MYNRRSIHIISFVLSILLLSVVLLSFYRQDSRTCLDVKILRSEKIPSDFTYVYRDLGKQLTILNQPVALDTDSSTIFVSCPENIPSSVRELDGSLVLSDLSCSMYFLGDPLLDDFSTAMQQSHPFQLIIVNKNHEYMQYQVVFTPLPVLCVDGDFMDVNQDGRNVMAGDMHFWDSGDSSGVFCDVQECPCQWHVRGGSSSSFQKKSLKLNLKKSSGSKKHMNLSEMGSDDDWILNSMSADDLNIREKVFMDLWNENASRDSFDYPVSCGEYTEVLINGEYAGVYLLQRRVDDKYLDLGKEDILLKGKPVWKPETMSDAYDIVSSPYSDEYTYSLVESMGSDYMITQNMDLHNFADVNLFMQLFSASDNIGFKNMFYALIMEGDRYTAHFIPWDTDLSLGMIWNGTNAWYHPDIAAPAMTERQETPLIQREHPEYRALEAARWKELRESLFTEENLIRHIDAETQELVLSGALLRDNAKYGLYTKGHDTLEGIKSFISNRLTYLDRYYQK